MRHVNPVAGISLAGMISHTKCRIGLHPEPLSSDEREDSD